ncbi:MAG: TraM recognition domain-containing protein, partial [Patescibacteria group bacterium]
GETSLANMAPYITTKFGNFTTNEYIRPIIGQTKSAFNFRQIMDEKKILLVNLSKGKIGDINAGLLGMIVTTRILMAALAREDASKDARPDFYFYIDEFQNFTTDSIATILSEARKYRLNLILAHQFIAQLEDKIRESVFGNVGSLMAFRVGEPDTEKLEKQFSPEFNAKDLISIENRNAIAKILINGEPSRPFNLHTTEAMKGSPEIREKLRELSRLSFGRPRSEIEQEILARLRN